MKKLIYFGFFAVSLSITSCSGEPDPVVDHDDPVKPDVQITSPANKDQFVVGDLIEVKIEVNHPDLVSDLQLYVADTLYADQLSLENQSISVDTKDANVGATNIYLLYKDGAGKEHRDNRLCTLFSDIQPQAKTAVLVNSYPHDPNSYTQGLEFYEGKLFEGTGRKGFSLLAEVHLESGQHVRSQPLDNSIFGEGITILNDTIYQISYLANTCFVYDMDFNKLTEFSYTGEGWGLCNDGRSIIMSNGTDRIVWRDPHTFQVEKELQIFDDQSNMTQINELELIDGNLFANIYTQDYIIEIDTSNGKVLSYIDCKSFVGQQPPSVDWFNGIAENDGRIYITGKLWPNLYEVKFE